MSFDATRWAFIQKVKPNAQFILLHISNCYNKKTERCDPSIKYLITESGLNERTVLSSIRRLEDIGLISVLKRHGKRNCYTLNLTIHVCGKYSLLPVKIRVPTTCKNTVPVKIQYLQKYSDTTCKNTGVLPVKIQYEPGRNQEGTRKVNNIRDESIAEIEPKVKKIKKTPMPDLVKYCPEFLKPELWLDYLAHRKDIKITMSEKAIKLASKKLTMLVTERGEDPEQCVAECIENGWRTFFPVKHRYQEKKQTGSNTFNNNGELVGDGVKNYKGTYGDIWEVAFEDD